MFSFLSMADNYEERKVGRDDYPWGFISTCYVNDGQKDYETAVKHKQYGTKMIIVENYDTKEQAAKGHKKWVQTMTSKKLPSELKDCMNCEISQMMLALGGKENIAKRKTK